MNTVEKIADVILKEFKSQRDGFAVGPAAFYVEDDCGPSEVVLNGCFDLTEIARRIRDELGLPIRHEGH